MEQRTIYRGGVWPNIDVRVEPRADGSLLVHNRIGLDDHPEHAGSAPC